MPATEETKSRLLAVAARASLSSATKTAAQEQWNDGMTVRLPLPARRGESPRLLLTIRLSVTALAAERELERMTPATGLTDFTGP